MDEQEEVRWRGKYLAIKTRGRWEYVSRVRGIEAAVILAIDGEEGDAPEDRHVILVEQYRVPLGAPCLELPAGLVGDEEEGEAIETAAARELEEETGYRAGKIENRGRFCSSPGMTSETFTLLRATGLEKVGEGGGVESENIIVHRVRMGEIASFVAAKRGDGCVIDVRILTLLGSAMAGSAAMASGATE